MPKIVHFGEFLKTWSLQSNSVTRQISFNRTKIGGKCQNWKKNQMRHFEEFLNNVNVVWLLVTDQYSLRPETFMEFANDESKVTFLFFLIFEPWIICGMPNAPQVVNWSFAHVVMIPQDKGRKMTSLIFWLSKSFQESSLQDALLLQADLLAKLFCPLLLSLQDISVVVLLLSHFYVKAVVSVSTQWVKN